MSVNLRRFVNLNVSRTKRNVVNPVRDTVALYGAQADFGESVTTNSVFTSGANEYNAAGNVTKYVLSGYDYATKVSVKVEIAAADFATSKLYAYAKTFFDNGGAKIHAYVGTAQVDSTTSKIKVGDLFIPNEEIAVAGINQTLSDVNALAFAYNQALNPASFTGEAVPNQNTSAAKVFAVNVAANSAAAVTEENVAVKRGSAGIEMSILAYLSRINVYGENTVNDYAFTIEQVDKANVFDDDATIGECMQNNINVDTNVARAVRNIGGDLITGHDVVNYYVTIIMQQTVEEAIMNVLSDKLSGADGTAVIYNAAVAELNKYVRCGLFAAGNWEDVDWVEEFNDESYVVVNAGERLTLGYKLMVIPFAAMTQAQVASHSCPPIYVAMTNKYGIRKVVINGEVR